MKTTSMMIATLLSMAQFAFADYSAVYFEKGSGRAKKLFTSEHKNQPQAGGDTVTSTYKDEAGNLLYQEKIQLAGAKIQKVEIEQKQTGESAVVEVKDGKIFFTKTSGGKTTTSDEKLKEPFVMSGSFQRYVAENWNDLKAGKTLNFRFGVWDRQETVGFQLSKTGEEDLAGQKVTVLRLKPSSFIIAALVDPLTFKYADGPKIVELIGRVPVKKKDGEKFKDQDAEVVYSHP